MVLDRPMERAILVQRLMDPHVVKTRQGPAQMGLPEYDHVVNTFVPISLSANPFCYGEPAAMGLPRMPMARNRRVTVAP
jgi:hypothetical protein